MEEVKNLFSLTKGMLCSQHSGNGLQCQNHNKLELLVRPWLRVLRTSWCGLIVTACIYVNILCGSLINRGQAERKLVPQHFSIRLVLTCGGTWSSWDIKLCLRTSFHHWFFYNTYTIILHDFLQHIKKLFCTSTFKGKYSWKQKKKRNENFHHKTRR